MSNRKHPLTVAIDDELKSRVDDFAREVFGESDVPRSRSRAFRILLRLGLDDPRRLSVK